MSKIFTPSKTSVNTIKFFKKFDEESLLESEQPEDVLSVFRFALILFDVDYSEIPPNNKLIEYFFNEFLPLYNADSLSKLNLI